VDSRGGLENTSVYKAGVWGEGTPCWRGGKVGGKKKDERNKKGRNQVLPSIVTMSLGCGLSWEKIPKKTRIIKTEGGIKKGGRKKEKNACFGAKFRMKMKESRC